MDEDQAHGVFTGDTSQTLGEGEQEMSFTELLEGLAENGAGLTVEPGGVKILAATIRRHHDEIVAMRQEVLQLRETCDRLLTKLPEDGFRMYVPPGTRSDQPPN